jgi:hypothetical protein
MAIPETFCYQCPAYEKDLRECRASPPAAVELNPNALVSPAPRWPKCEPKHWCYFGRTLMAALA